MKDIEALTKKLQEVQRKAKNSQDKNIKEELDTLLKVEKTLKDKV